MSGYSSAVLDMGLEELTPLQPWSTVVTEHGVLDECARILDVAAYLPAGAQWSVTQTSAITNLPDDPTLPIYLTSIH